MTGKLRIKTLTNFLSLCSATLRYAELPTVNEIMLHNPCCRSNAYQYLYALQYLFPKDKLKQERRRRIRRVVAKRRVCYII